ncbi:MAG: TIM barrel protein [Actinobacteria bacterium]|nr:TIM barrel protein [Actinomycetota bacterium]
MRFSANLSMLFTEFPFAERFGRAAAAGFDAVELWWPGDADAERVPDLAQAAGVDVVLLNFDAGDMPAGDRGLLSDRRREGDFRANVPVALEIAAAVGCRNLNALAGVAVEGVTRAEQIEFAQENARIAADAARDQGAEVVIEAVNTFENGDYLLPTAADAADFIAGVGRPNVRLLFDAYHTRRMGLPLEATLREVGDRVAHVQIADCPGRHEPGTGDTDFDAFFAALDEVGYAGPVGLEYKPSAGDTVRSLAWMSAVQERRHEGSAR